MSEQQSQKRGVRSEAQKAIARDGYGSVPAANPVAGALGDRAFGDRERPTPKDEGVAHSVEENRKSNHPREAE